ncbi:hypothetical protein [Aquimarina pacifica]|uniref:hypothetical protein n=1 Tax=Aquimarina pacifica TaxID=1296415 RepID=UPI0004704057|nr:hypothetical protein [Aquimarina pacifica]
MKPFLLPITLITFAILCLSIVHIDNVNKLDEKSEELRKKHQIENVLDDQKENRSDLVSRIK